ncbi:MAG: 2'-5' RNA ligase family protein [Gemmatimonadota bacterium]
MSTRRQATLFVPPPHNPALEALRTRFNPVQSDLIRAHVTLCREDEVDDWMLLSSRLAGITPIAVTLRFTAPVRDRDLVYLPASGSTESFDSLRHSLLSPGGQPPRKHQPHITLIHPRNGTCSDADFMEIATQVEPFQVTFRAVTLIEQVDGGRWTDIAAFS